MMAKEYVEDNVIDSAEKKKKGMPAFVAFLICVLIAFVIWCYAKGAATVEQMEAEGNGIPETEASVDRS